jgi:hypothetical protein
MNSLPNENPALTATSREEAIRQLGDPIATFKPGMENLVAGVIIGLLMVIGGGALSAFAIREAIINGDRLPWFAEKGSCLAAVVAMGVIGLMLAGAGLVLIYWVKGLFSLRVLVCPAGFLCVRRTELQVFPWIQIERLQETVTQEYFPLKGIAKYAAPIGKSRSFVVRRRDGVEFGFDGNTVKNLNTLARLLEEQSRHRSIPWEVVRQ